MIPAPIPQNEFTRIKELKTTSILDTEQDIRYDYITQYAATMLNAPICLNGFIDVDRIWYKSTYGIDLDESSRSTSICGHAIIEVKENSCPNERIFEVSDLHSDIRFFGNPFILSYTDYRSALMYVLQSVSGMNLGALCIIDNKPRVFTKSDRDTLILLGSMIENLMYGRHHLTGIEDKFT